MWSQECRKLTLLLLSFLILGCVNANKIIAKRDDSSSSSGNVSDVFLDAMNSAINELIKLPIIGSILQNSLDGLYNAAESFEIATNGFLGRIMGGSLPCTISENGTTCQGISDNGGIGILVINAINEVPDLFLPSIVKKLIVLSISSLWDPLFDVIFGGMPTA
ncbi:uncharacterized protein [Prorops nasuta]|uniref:uncharacterized protein n=1 Tax=Prorops nasuta TaxID=863751 RepID=UPI0034CDB0A6